MPISGKTLSSVPCLTIFLPLSLSYIQQYYFPGCFLLLSSHYFPFFFFSSFSIFSVPALFNGLLHLWRADPPALPRSRYAPAFLTGTSPHQRDSWPSELFIPTHPHSPATALRWACHLHWAQVLLPARCTEIESLSPLPRRAKAKGLHRCQGLSCKTGQLVQGEPHPARQSEVICSLSYHIPGNEANMKTFIGFILSFQCFSLISFEHLIRSATESIPLLFYL